LRGSRSFGSLGSSPRSVTTGGASGTGGEITTGGGGTVGAGNGAGHAASARATEAR